MINATTARLNETTKPMANPEDFITLIATLEAGDVPVEWLTWQEVVTFYPNCNTAREVGDHNFSPRRSENSLTDQQPPPAIGTIIAEPLSALQRKNSRRERVTGQKRLQSKDGAAYHSAGKFSISPLTSDRVMDRVKPKHNNLSHEVRRGPLPTLTPLDRRAIQPSDSKKANTGRNITSISAVANPASLPNASSTYRPGRNTSYLSRPVADHPANPQSANSKSPGYGKELICLRELRPRSCRWQL